MQGITHFHSSCCPICQCILQFIKLNTKCFFRPNSVIRLRNSSLAQPIIHDKRQNVGNSHLLSRCNSDHKCKVHLSILQSTLDPLLLIKTELGALQEQGTFKGAGTLASFPYTCRPPMLSLSLVSTHPGAVMTNSGCPSASIRVPSLYCQCTVPASVPAKLKILCVRLVRSPVFTEVCYSLVL